MCLLSFGVCIPVDIPPACVLWGRHVSSPAPLPIQRCLDDSSRQVYDTGKCWHVIRVDVLTIRYQVRVHDCDGGWVAGQHICLRIFFSGRILESHPLSILSAPPAYSCLSNPGLVLGARVNGDWTRALNTFVHKEQERLSTIDESCHSKDRDVSIPIQVMLDGPYGGSSVDLGQYETVLLVSGGSGITFTLGLLDDIVGRCVKLRRGGGERTRRIEFAWCIRSFGEPPQTQLIHKVPLTSRAVRSRQHLLVRTHVDRHRQHGCQFLDRSPHLDLCHMFV